MKNVLELLEQGECLAPDKPLFLSEHEAYSYCQVGHLSRAVGTALCTPGSYGRPVAVLMEKSPRSLCAFFGVVYSGHFYVVIDVDMPAARIQSILDTLQPSALLTEHACRHIPEQLSFSCPVFLYEQIVQTAIDQPLLASVRKRMIDTDPLYALFTSGSTGVPKGTVVNHKNVLTYSQWVTDTFQLNEDTIFGNQAPFYFSMSVLDIFSTLRAKASMHIIPKACFSFPLSLLNYLKTYRINTIYWVPTALCLLANWNALDGFPLPDLQKVLFAGEVMPTKQLNYWRKHLPDILYANLYGPTEVTDICTYYIVDRPFQDFEPLPIGKACDNCQVLVLTEDDRQAEQGEEGELCVRGSILAMGYYGQPEKTASAFVQNPLNPFYPELIYRTGDLVRMNEHQEFIYITRKDFQIKKSGYRIELGEIEAAASSLSGIAACACVYETSVERIKLFFQGNAEIETVRQSLRSRLPAYMIPDDIFRLSSLPLNANGKIDRKTLLHTSP